MKTVTMSLHLANKCLQKLKAVRTTRDPYNDGNTYAIAINRNAIDTYPEWIAKVGKIISNKKDALILAGNIAHDALTIKCALFEANVNSGVNAHMIGVEKLKLEIAEAVAIESATQETIRLSEIPVDVAFTERRDSAVYNVLIDIGQLSSWTLADMRRALLSKQNKISELNALTTITVALHDNVCEFLGL